MKLQHSVYANSVYDRRYKLDAEFQVAEDYKVYRTELDFSVDDKLTAQLGKEIMDSSPSYVDISPNIVRAHAAASAQDVAQDVQILLPDEPPQRIAATRRIRKDPFPDEVEPYTVSEWVSEWVVA